MSNPFKHVAVMYGKFGPYHRARLRAAAGAVRGRGGRLTGIEVARTSSTYAWADDDAEEPYARITLMDDDRAVWSWSPEAWATVQRALTKLNPSALAVAGWVGPANLSALDWGRARGRPTIVLSDSKIDDRPRHPVKEWMKGFLVRQFDAALTAGGPHRDYLERLGLPRERIFFGADVVDNDYFARRAAEARAEADRHRRALGVERPFFLAVSRLIELKNLDRLIEAFGHYRQMAPAATAWDLAIVGGGPEEARLRALAERAAPGAVHFAGFQQIDTLPTWYGLAECLVHPSLKETWGLVINEGMAAGLPLVVSRTIGARMDLLEEGVNGWSFDPEDAHDIARLMARMADRPEADRRAMGEASRRIVSKWGPSRYAEGLCGAIEAGAEKAASRRPGLSIPARLAIRLSMRKGMRG